MLISKLFLKLWRYQMSQLSAGILKIKNKKIEKNYFKK